MCYNSSKTVLAPNVLTKEAESEHVFDVNIMYVICIVTTLFVNFRIPSSVQQHQCNHYHPCQKS